MGAFRLARRGARKPPRNEPTEIGAWGCRWRPVQGRSLPPYPYISRFSNIFKNGILRRRAVDVVALKLLTTDPARPRARGKGADRGFRLESHITAAPSTPPPSLENLRLICEAVHTLVRPQLQQLWALRGTLASKGCCRLQGAGEATMRHKPTANNGHSTSQASRKGRKERYTRETSSQQTAQSSSASHRTFEVYTRSTGGEVHRRYVMSRVAPIAQNPLMGGFEIPTGITTSPRAPSPRRQRSTFSRRMGHSSPRW